MSDTFSSISPGCRSLLLSSLDTLFSADVFSPLKLNLQSLDEKTRDNNNGGQKDNNECSNVVLLFGEQKEEATTTRCVL